MNNCFIIQPFDGGVFDDRYKDVFKPAIEAAGLKPYRVDEDPSSRIPIENIEKGINESKICFAEITTDNPNVWYELGYAFACRKDVVMACSEERSGKYPFDIQHRNIIKYSNSSPSGFKKLEAEITKRLIAYLQKTQTLGRLQNNPIAEKEGLKGNEIAILAIIMGNTIGTNETVSTYKLREEMNKTGYNDLATSVGVHSLREKNFIQELEAYDNHEPYSAFQLTYEGKQWIISNTDQLNFHLEKPTSEQESDQEFMESLPF